VSGLQLKDITKNAQSNQWDHGKGKVYGGWWLIFHPSSQPATAQTCEMNPR
jgi:hypothetical protein